MYHLLDGLYDVHMYHESSDFVHTTASCKQFMTH